MKKWDEERKLSTEYYVTLSIKSDLTPSIKLDKFTTTQSQMNTTRILTDAPNPDPICFEILDPEKKQ